MNPEVPSPRPTQPDRAARAPQAPSAVAPAASALSPQESEEIAALVQREQAALLFKGDVVDTGIGIAAHDQDKVFDDFYQVNNPGRDRNQGLDIVDGVASMLAVHGVHVWKATEPSQAIAALDAAQDGRPIEVLLCDVRLGKDMDGLELVKVLSATRASMPRVILMTGDTAPQDMRRLQASGYLVLSKPVGTTEPLAALARPALA